MLIYIRVGHQYVGTTKTTDTNGSNVSLLLSNDGVGTVFTDTSNANNTITSNMVSQGFMGPYNSIDAASFQGNGYLDLGTSQTAALGLGDYTLDVWFNSSTLSGNQNILWLNGNDSAGGYCAINLLTIGSQLAIRCSYEGIAWDIDVPNLTSITAGQWHYYSVQKSGNNLTVYLDGSLLQTLPLTMPLMSGTVNFVGAGPTGARDFLTGAVTELRLAKGVTRYSGATSTVPLAPAGTTLGLSTDPQAANVSLLMHFNDVYGPNVFTEECSNVVTAVQGPSDSFPVISNYSSKFGGSSGQFSGGNYISLPNMPQYGLPGDFTLEFFVNFHTPVVASQQLFMINSQASGLSVRASTGGIYCGVANVDKGTGTLAGFTWATNTWHHICIVRTAGTLEVYINGARRSKVAAVTTAIPMGAVYIGGSPSTAIANGLCGNVDELRLTKNVARYTNNFTVPSAPLVSIPQTSLLVSGNAVGDSGPYSLPVGTNVMQMDPFANATYSYNSNGISDSMVTATSLQYAYGTGAFTIEFWINPQSIPTWTTGNFYLFDHGTNVGYLNYTAGKLNFVGTSTHITTSTVTIPQNAWTHIAVVRKTYNVAAGFAIYVNGVAQTMANTTSTWNPVATMVMSIGRVGSGTAANNFPGLISNFRVVKGTAVYTANFTPPTSPLTAIAGTSLLTCQTNPMTDASGNAIAVTLNTVTAPVPTTATIPFTNASSLQFNGTNAKATVFSNNLFTFGTSDFSIELWYNSSVASTSQGLLSNSFTATQATGTWKLMKNSANKFIFSNWATVLLTGTTTVAINTWYHVVVQRVNGYLQMFVNGVPDTAATVNYPTSLNYTANLQIGWEPNTAYFMTGFLSNIRILTNGVAYTVGDAVPTAQFPTVPLLPTNLNEPFLQNVSLQLDGESLTADAFGAPIVTKVGNVDLSYTTKQSGFSSLWFTGAGRLTVPGNPSIQLTITDFTVECFVFIGDLTSNKQVLLDFRDTTSSADTTLSLYNSTGADGQSNCFTWAANDTYASTSGVDMITGYWYHVAVTRTSGVLQIFVNGTSRYSGVDITDYTNGVNTISIGGAIDNTNLYNGCLDQVRVTKAASRYSSNFIVPTTAFTIGTYGVDPYASNISLYVKGDGTGNSLIIPDSSSNTFNQMVSTNVTVDTYALQTTGPFASNNYSALFTSASGNQVTNLSALSSVGVSYLTNPAGYALITPLAQAYTIECWVNPTSFANSPILAACGSYVWVNGSTPGYNWVLGLSATGQISYSVSNGSATVSTFTLTTTATIALNTWSHIAVVRKANNVTSVYVNGVVNAATFTDVSPTINYYPTGVSIGGGLTIANNTNLSGSMSNFRIVVGTAVYTAGFTPPTAPLTAIAGTSLLTLQSSKLIDNSPTGAALTPWVLGNGGANPVNVQANLGPYSTMPYSTHLAGTYALYTTPANTNYQLSGTESWTVECWVNPVAANLVYGQHLIAYMGNAAAAWNTTTGYQYAMSLSNDMRPSFVFNSGGAAVTIAAANAIGLYCWTHLAAVRTAGVVTFYVNGVSVGTSASTPSSTTAPAKLIIGGYTSAANTQFATMNGFISNARIVKGTAVYTANFVPPKITLTAIANTTFLAFTDATVTTDKSVTGAVLTPQGASQLTTSAYRNGTAALNIGNYRLQYDDHPSLQFGTGAFTIEFWIYRNAATANTIFSKQIIATASSGYMSCTIAGTTNVISLNNTIGSAAICTLKGLNTWQHVAIVKTDTTLMCFLDGQQTYNAANTFNFTSTEPFRIGNNGSNALVNTYLDDFRVTKGIARYTGNFSLPQSVAAPNLYLTTPMVTQPTDYRSALIASWTPVVGTTYGKVYISTSPSIVAGTRITNSIADSQSNGVQIGDSVLQANTTYYIAPIATGNIGGDSKIGPVTVARSGPVLPPRDLSITNAYSTDYNTMYINMQTPPYSFGSYSNGSLTAWNGITIYYSTSPGVIPGAPGVSSVNVGGIMASDTFTGAPYLYSAKNLAGLQPATTYYITATSNSTLLTAIQSGGASMPVAEISFTTPATPTIPAAPTGVVVTAVDPYTFQVTWNVAAGVTSYTLYGARTNYAGGVGPGAAGVNYDYTIGPFTAATTGTQTYTWTGWPAPVAAAASYFSVVASNSGGTSVASAQNTTNSMANTAAGAIVLANAACNTIRITWAAGPSYVVGYRLWFSQTTGFNDTNYADFIDVLGQSSTSTYVARSGPSQVWYARMSYLYQSPAQYSTLSPQITASTTTQPILTISPTIDATRGQVSFTFASMWNINDTVTIYQSTVNPCLGNEQVAFTTTNTSPFIVRGLAAGVTYYWYAVTNYSNAAPTGPSAQVSTAMPAALLSSIAFPLTTPTQFKMTWALPTMTNIDNYNIWIGVSSSAALAAAGNYDVGAAQTRSFLDMNLGARGSAIGQPEILSHYLGGFSPSTTYYVRAGIHKFDTISGNWYGSDNVKIGMTAALSFTTKAATVIGAPGDLTAALSGTTPRTSVVLTWTPVAGATGYSITRRALPDDSTGPGHYRNTTYAVGAVGTYTVTDARPGCTNVFVIQSISAGGYSDISAEVSIDTAPVVAIPTPTTAQAADPYTNVIVNWTAWAGDGGVTGYRLYVNPVSSGIPTAGMVTYFNTPYMTVGNVLTATVTGLQNGTAYYICLQPFNTTYGPTYQLSAPVTYTTLIPAAPSGITAVLATTAHVTNGITMNWTAVAGATQYNVFLKQGSAPVAGDPSTNITPATTYTWTGLIAGETYYVGIQAYTPTTYWTNVGSPVSALTIPQIPLPYAANASLSTSNKKFGTGSIRLPGDTTTKGLIANHIFGFDLAAEKFTIDGWIYLDSTSSVQEIVSKSNPAKVVPSWRLYTTAGGILKFDASSVNATNDIANAIGTLTIPAATWTFIALVRNGSTFTLYVNGAVSATATSAATFASYTGPVHIGASIYTTNNMLGNVDNLRLTRSVARYTGAFTNPTTEPFTNVITDSFIQSVSLLVHTPGLMNSTALVDSSITPSTITASGGAKQVSFRNRYGQYSLAIPSATSVVTIPAATKFAFGTKNFTIEAWVFITSATNAFNIFSTGSATTDFSFGVNTAGALTAKFNGATTSLAGTITPNTWTHVAVVNSFGTLYSYVNAVNVGSLSTAATAFTNTQPVTIGAASNSGTGYVTELRVTTGAARSIYISATVFPDPSMCDPYWMNTQMLLTGNPVNGSPFITDACNKVSLASTSLSATLSAINPKNQIIATWPETAWAAGYVVYYSTSPNVGLAGDAGTLSVTNSTYYGVPYSSGGYISNTQATLTGLAANTTYYIRYRVLTTEGVYSALSSTTVSITTAVIPTVTGVTATPVVPTKGSVQIDWSAYTSTVGTTGTITGYNMYYGTSPTLAGATKVVISGTSTLTSLINSLTAATPYYFAVTAVTSWGESGFSTIQTVTTTAAVAALVKDSSSRLAAITTSGAPTQMLVGPTVGITSSVYFDGLTDLLGAGATAVLSLGTTFTVEFWMNMTVLPPGSSNMCRVLMFGANATPTALAISINYLGLIGMGVPNTGAIAVSSATGAIVPGTWTHVALVNNAGTAQIYIDGAASGASVPTFTSQTAGSVGLVVGRDTVGTVNAIYKGYLSNLRIVKGTAVYTSNFTAPATPLTAITNTQLLLRMDGL